MTRTGLTASVIVSNWTWAATLLQSSNVAWAYGVSGPFWYASGATIQIILFGVLAVSLKKVAPKSHTVCEIVRARWGRAAHFTFLFFCFVTNIIVTSMLLLGGAATVEALTGVDYRLASFLIPWGVVLYTATGGLQANFISNYFHSVVIFAGLITMIFAVYIKIYSSDTIYKFLKQTSNWTKEECQVIYSRDGNIESTFYEPGKYACGLVSGNEQGSFLTMLSSNGLMFGIINIVGNFGTVFVDQSYWQSAMAAHPKSAAPGFVLAGYVYFSNETYVYPDLLTLTVINVIPKTKNKKRLCWFAIPFSLATSLGLASTALMLPINAAEAGAGLVPPAVATELLGQAGAVLILIMLFMAIVSTGAAESIAVSSLVAYDIYREYINPTADGEQILFIARLVVVIFGVFMGCFSIILFELGLNLGWVYLFMGVVIGSAVAPLWNLMTWKKASGTGAVLAAWSGLVLALIAWTVAAKFYSGSVTIETLGSNAAMLSGNLVAILSSAMIHWAYSTFVDPQDYDFSQMDKHITLVEDDQRGLSDEERDPTMIATQERWVSRRAYLLTLILVVAWPALATPAGVFSESYFAFWVLIAVSWGFGAAICITVLPLTESWDDIDAVIHGMIRTILCRPKEVFDTDDEQAPFRRPSVRVSTEIVTA